jgi:hypothetical protein
MNEPNAALSGPEIVALLEQWLESRERLRASGEDVLLLDQQILPFKNRYVRSGAIYGANSAGMLRWYAEARPDQPANAVPPTSTETS